MLSTSYYRIANAILVVFDKNNIDSYNSLDKWLENIKKFSRNNPILILVGNKCDLETEVSTDEIQEKVLRHQVPFVEVSAKTGLRIDYLFEILARKLVETQITRMRYSKT